MKRWIALCCSALSLCLLLAGCGTGGEQSPTEGENASLRIVTTVFPAYDFARAVAGERAEVTLLLPPGTESHSYEPTPADIVSVEECDLFIYLGGESDAWVDTILDSVGASDKAMRMIDCVDLLEEETVEGMEAEHEDHDHDLGAVVGYDEHVWTSPRNAAAITRAIGARLEELDAAHAQDYAAGAEAYAGQLAIMEHYAEQSGQHPDFEEIICRGKAGEPLAQSVLSEAGFYFGVALSNLIKTFEIPDVVIGGSPALADSPFMEAARSALRDYNTESLGIHLRLRMGQLPERQYALGGCYLVFDHMFSRPKLALTVV